MVRTWRTDESVTHDARVTGIDTDTRCECHCHFRRLSSWAQRSGVRMPDIYGLSSSFGGDPNGTTLETSCY
jgi:hypothetical protein